jgi:hypothetical protein
MMTMVSTFLSFLAGGLPKILQIFQDRQDKKHELALVAAQKERELALAERWLSVASLLRHGSRRSSWSRSRLRLPPKNVRLSTTTTSRSARVLRSG